jgi:hypothetical protein
MLLPRTAGGASRDGRRCYWRWPAVVGEVSSDFSSDRAMVLQGAAPVGSV